MMFSSTAVSPADIVLGKSISVTQERSDTGEMVEVTYVPAALCYQRPILFFYCPEVNPDGAACMLVFDPSDPLDPGKNAGFRIPMPGEGETFSDVLAKLVNEEPTDLESALAYVAAYSGIEILRDNLEENREELVSMADPWLNGMIPTRVEEPDAKTGMYL